MDKYTKNKKRIKIVLILLIIILLLILGITLYLKITEEYYKNKGYEVFGSEICEGHKMAREGLDVLCTINCKICGTELSYATWNENNPIICSNCAEMTNRCEVCGKLLNEENENE